MCGSTWNKAAFQHNRSPVKIHRHTARGLNHGQTLFQTRHKLQRINRRCHPCKIPFDYPESSEKKFPDAITQFSAQSG